MAGRLVEHDLTHRKQVIVHSQSKENGAYTIASYIFFTNRVLRKRMNRTIGQHKK